MTKLFSNSTIHTLILRLGEKEKEKEKDNVYGGDFWRKSENIKI